MRAARFDNAYRVSAIDDNEIPGHATSCIEILDFELIAVRQQFLAAGCAAVSIKINITVEAICKLLSERNSTHCLLYISSLQDDRIFRRMADAIDHSPYGFECFEVTTSGMVPYARECQS